MPKPKPRYYTSDLSAFCAQELPGDFNYMDGDEVLLRYSALPITFARETRILRILESKRPGEEVRRSQVDVLPLLADLIDAGMERGSVATGSGVFVVEGVVPYVDGATVSRVKAGGSRTLGLQFDASYVLSREQVETFVRCRPLSQKRAAA